MSIHTEPIEIAGISCDLEISSYPQINTVVYQVRSGGCLSAEHKGALTEDNGSLRRAAIREADATLRAEWEQWAETLV